MHCGGKQACLSINSSFATQSLHSPVCDSSQILDCRDVKPDSVLVKFLLDYIDLLILNIFINIFCSSCSAGGEEGGRRGGVGRTVGQGETWGVGLEISC